MDIAFFMILILAAAILARIYVRGVRKSGCAEAIITENEVHIWFGEKDMPVILHLKSGENITTFRPEWKFKFA